MGCGIRILLTYIEILQQENSRLKDKLNKINDLLNEPIFEYDNIPSNIENEIIQNNKLTSLADSIVCLIDSAKKTAAVSVSYIMVKTYWAVGKHIV